MILGGAGRGMRGGLAVLVVFVERVEKVALAG